MSLSGLTKRLRRSKNKSNDNTDQDQRSVDSPSRNIHHERSTPESADTNTDTSARSRRGASAPPAERNAGLLSMPTPETAPAASPTSDALTAHATRHAMDSALASLAPLQSQLSAGPSVSKLDRGLDNIGEHI